MEESQSLLTPGWEDVHLIPSSLPVASFDKIDIAVDLCGVKLRAPFVIASMTGGHGAASEVNERLAATAQEVGVAIGSGSQRAALRDPQLARSYSIIRETAPDAVVFANIGVCQLVDQETEPGLTRDEIETVIGMLDAQFLIVHLNAIEEVIQPEGDSRLGGLVEGFERVVDYSSVPLVAKETGAGMSRDVANELAGTGVEMLDVGGAGGTSFARIEGLRARRRGDQRRARLGETFADWGIPTATSILEVAPLGLPVIATGGVRTGLDAAKALALGASAAGVGRPILEAALQGADSAIEAMSILVEELKLATLLTGCSAATELRSNGPVLTGRTAAWSDQRRLLDGRQDS